MRLDQLGLIAYGPFTGTQLDFSPAVGLHIIYGPNEAGKSSALRAITDALYGIPSRTADNFLHPYPKLRLGFHLRDRQGEGFQAVRRKGNANTLRAADDQAKCEDKPLQRWLSGVDREAFEMMFGINHERLRQGGEQLVRQGGKLGQILFSAGSGISNLQSVQQQLATRADQLFKLNGRSGELYKQLADYQTLVKQVKELQVPVAAWKQLEERRLQAERNREKLETELLQKQEQLQRATRIQDSYPLLIKWQQEQDEQFHLAQVPELPDGFSESVQQWLTHRQAQEKLLESSRISHEHTVKLQQQLQLNDRLLAEAELISGLLNEAGACSKARDDRPGLQQTRNQSETAARDILTQLGRPNDLSQVEQLRVPSDAQARIQHLGQELGELRARREAAERQFRKAQRDRTHLSQSLEQIAAPPEHARLKLLIQQIERQGDWQAQYHNLAAELDKLDTLIQKRLKQLPGWFRSLHELEAASLPLPETVEHFHSRYADQQTQLQTLREQLTRDQEHAAKIQQELTQLEGDQPVLTLAELQEARQLREQGWQLILRDWQQSGQPILSPAEFLEQTSASDLAEGFEQTTHKTDQLADALRQDADRVAQKAFLQAQAHTVAQRIELRQTDLSQAEADWEQFLQEWASAWQPAGITPQTPREMQSWQRKTQDLLDHAVTRGDLIARQQQLLRLAAEFHSQLQRLLPHDQAIAHAEQQSAQAAENSPSNSADEDSRSPILPSLTRSSSAPLSSAPLTQLLQRLADATVTLEQWQAAALQRSQLQRSLEATQTELQDAEAQLEQAESQLQTWQTQWARQMQLIGLDADASPQQAERVLRELTQLFDQLRTAQQLQTRINEIDQFIGDFTQRMRQLQERLGQPQAAVLPEAVIQSLNQQLQQAITHREKFQVYAERLEELQLTLDQTEQELGHVRRQLTDACQLAGADCPEDLPEIARNAQKKQASLRRLKDFRLQLLSKSAGKTLEQFVAEIQTEAEQIDALPSRIETLRREIEDLQQRRDLFRDELTTVRLEQGRIDGGSLAAEKAAEAESLAALIEQGIEQLASLRLADALLRTSIERYRENNQGPVLSRASELFAALTCQHYTGLEVDYGDLSEPILKGRRAASLPTPFATQEAALVDLSQMSDGTCDQLYLAVRLATLDLRQREHEPLPLILDDILLNFDNQRSAAAIRVLAEFAQQTQILFFTHHAHLLELVQQHLPASSYQIHTLTPWIAQGEQSTPVDPAAEKVTPAKSGKSSTLF